jgi:hypothetical protein
MKVIITDFVKMKLHTEMTNGKSYFAKYEYFINGLTQKFREDLIRDRKAD